MDLTTDQPHGSFGAYHHFHHQSLLTHYKDTNWSYPQHIGKDGDNLQYAIHFGHSSQNADLSTTKKNISYNLYTILKKN
jgi:hypothetical protein